MTNPRPIPVPKAAVGQLGGYALADLKAPAVPVPSKNKAIELGNNLNKFFGVATQYASLAEEDFNLYQKQLARKSPEDIEKKLKQTEGEIDRQTRRGFIPWFTSPLNKERKLRADGALLHDEYERQLKAQVEDPANADADINELIAGVKDNLRNQYGSLQSTFVNEGFEGAIRETTRRYTLAHDSLSTAQARNQLYRAGKNVLFNSAILIKDEVTGNTRMADADLLNQWYEENQGALTPAELLKLRKEVTLELAQRDPDSARNFLNYTTGFKVGTSKMSEAMGIKGEDVFSMYGAEEADIYEDIDKIELQAQAKNVHAANQEFAVIDELAVDIGMALKAGQVFVTKEGEEISNEKQAKTYLLNKLQQSDNILVRGSNGVKTVETALKLFETEPDNFIPFFNKIRNAGLDNNLNNRLKQAESFILSQNLMEVQGADGIGKQIINPLYQRFASEIRFELDEERRQKIRELSSGNYLNVKGEEVRSTAWDSEVMEDMARWDRYYHEQFQTRLNEKINGKLEQDKKDAEEASKQKATREIIEGKSFLDPTTPLSEATTLYKDLPNIFSAFTNPYDLESNLREGDLEDARSWVENFEKQTLKTKTVPLPVLGSIPILSYRNELENTIKLIQNPKTSTESKEKAQKLMSLYLFAKGLYTPENIANGNVNIEVGGTPETTKLMPVRQAERKGFTILERGLGAYGGIAEVKVPAVEGVNYNVRIDREAVKRFAEIFPMIPKERLIEMSRVGTDDLSKEQAMYEAIHNVTPDEAALKAWIEKQRDLAQKIYKN